MATPGEHSKKSLALEDMFSSLSRFKDIYIYMYYVYMYYVYILLHTFGMSAKIKMDTKAEFPFLTFKSLVPFDPLAILWLAARIDSQGLTP